MSVAVSHPAPTISQSSAEPNRWIAGRTFDLVFFIFSYAWSLLVLIPFAFLHHDRLAGALLFGVVWGINTAHTVMTFFFFFDRQIWDFYSKRIVATFLFPLAQIALVFGLMLNETTRPYITLFAVVYTAYHWMRQSVGLVSFYRVKWGMRSPADKAIDNAPVYAAVGFLTAVQCFFPADYRRLFPEFIFEYWIDWAILAAVAVWFLYTFARMAAKRLAFLRETGGKSWPYLTMIASAILGPLPLAWPLFIDAPTEVMFFAVISFAQLAHGIQYTAIVALFNTNKFKARPRTERTELADQVEVVPELITGRLSFAGVWLFAAFTLGITGLLALFFYGSQFSLFTKEATVNTALFTLANATIMSIAFLHYWYDSMFWAMKEEFNRKTILPYIRPFGK